VKTKVKVKAPFIRASHQEKTVNKVDTFLVDSIKHSNPNSNFKSTAKTT